MRKEVFQVSDALETTHFFLRSFLFLKLDLRFLFFVFFAVLRFWRHWEIEGVSRRMYLCFYMSNDSVNL